MSTAPVAYRDMQVRTLEHIYRFQMESSQDSPVCFLTIEVYNQYRTLLSGQVRSVSETDWQEVFSSEKGDEVLKQAARKGWIVEPAQPQERGDLKKIIAVARSRIPVEGKSLASFICPLSMHVFVDPVLDSCGHTFEREWIERALVERASCPLSRQRIHSLTPIHQLRQVLATWRQRDPIPTLSGGKTPHPELARKNLEIAQLHTQEINADPDAYHNALRSYEEAFKYTQDWHAYEAIPLFFVKQGQLRKAQLAYLYLAEYQIQAGSLAEAIESLKAYKALHPSLSVDVYLAQLCHRLGRIEEAIHLLIEAAEVSLSVSTSLALYVQALQYAPYRWDVYEKLSSLRGVPMEQSHLLLRGACHAMEKHEEDVARDLCVRAARYNRDFFIDRLIDLRLYLPPYSQDADAVKRKLLSFAREYESSGCVGEMVQAYKYLSYLEYHPTYYEKLVEGFHVLGQKPQFLFWATRWTCLLIEKQEWEKAGQMVLQILQRGGVSLALQHHLERIYTYANRQVFGDAGPLQGPETAAPPPPEPIPGSLGALSSYAFGKTVWNTYFGDVGEEPPLPAYIDTLLCSPCPFWPGKQVKDTHLLVLIPRTVNGQPFTLKRLVDLVKTPLGGGQATQIDGCRSWLDAVQAHASNPAPASHWVLMPKYALPKSPGKTYDVQRAAVNALDAAYEVGHLLDAVTCVLLNRVRTGEFLFAEEPDWMRVQEKTQGYRLVFGAFSGLGLRIYGALDGNANAYVGLAILRKF